MFAKTILIVLALGTTIIGLLFFFNTGEYFIFAIGFALYFILSISSSFCKRMNK